MNIYHNHHGIIILVFLSIIITVGSQTTYWCPPNEGAKRVIPHSTLIRIPIITDNNTLCTLVRHNTTAGGTQRTPVARSYGARGLWEVSAGLFSDSAISNLTIDCNIGVTYCNVILPPITNGQEYILESFYRSTLSNDIQAARFLEQSTFGSTRTSIDELVASGLDYESWIIDQINLPISSFREYYRRRVNPKFDFPNVIGGVGAGPCDLYSRWRTYAVSLVLDT